MGKFNLPCVDNLGTTARSLFIRLDRKPMKALGDAGQPWTVTGVGVTVTRGQSAGQPKESVEQ